MTDRGQSDGGVMPSPAPASAGARTTAGDVSGNRRRDIQGLRAVAVLVVVLFHAGLPIPGGFVGVDVFFVISGFVITAMLHREWLATGAIRFRTFYVRRFKRLTPALALMVSVTVVVSAVVMTPFGPQENVALTALGAMLLTANVVIARTTGGYFDAPAETNPLLNTWSLSVEEQFYLVFPLLLFIGWRLTQRARVLSRTPTVLVAVVTLGSFGLAVLGSRGFVLPGAPWLLGFYSPFTRAWEFGAGALLALLMVKRSALARGLSTSAGVLGMSLLVVSVFAVNAQTPFPGYWTLLPVLGTVLLLLAGFDEGNPVSRWLALGPPVAVGDWSYSIYLWHWPMIVFAGLLWPGNPGLLVLAAVVSLVPALASYRWVEQPLRWDPTQTRARLTALITASLALPILLATIVGLSASRDLWIAQLWVPSLRNFSSWSTSHEGWDECLSRGTMSGDPTQVNPFGSCRWNASSPGEPIYLVGDSNANQFSEALIGVSRQLGGPLVLSAAASCPLSDITIGAKGEYNAASAVCREHVSSTMKGLISGEPGVVVIANADNYVFDDGYSLGTGIEASTSDRQGKAVLFEEGLRRTVEELQEAGHEVVLVQPVHRFDRPEYRWNVVECTVLDFAEGGCVTTAPLSFFEELQLESRAAVSRVAGDTGATLLDLRPYLCLDGECSTREGDMALYGDPAHISIDAGLAMTPAFSRAVDDALIGR